MLSYNFDHATSSIKDMVMWGVIKCGLSFSFYEVLLIYVYSNSP